MEGEFADNRFQTCLDVAKWEKSGGWQFIEIAAVLMVEVKIVGGHD